MQNPQAGQQAKPGAVPQGNAEGLPVKEGQSSASRNRNKNRRKKNKDKPKDE
jgi:hypothetical protein